VKPSLYIVGCCAAAVLAAGALALTAQSGAAATLSQSEPALRLRSAAATGAEAVEKELDFSNRNDSAVMEGTVLRGHPHRYIITAIKGQSLSAKLQSKEGTRFDVYEPGSSLTLLSGGYVVQGARVGSETDGTNLEAKLPSDGKYLLLLRTEGDQAFYTLELAVREGGLFSVQRLLDKKSAWAAAAFLVAALGFVMLHRRKRRRRIFRPD
jgi:hypothetical protein